MTELVEEGMTRDRGVNSETVDPTAIETTSDDEDEFVVAVHQPNYLPWLGYFEKILRSDVFVFLDDVEYSANSFTNRNRIKTPDGWTWLTVPVSGSSDEIRDVQIATDQRWRKNHLKNLTYNYANAPYHDAFEELFERTYDEQWHSIAELNIHLICELAARLELECTFVRSSEMGIESTKTDRVVDICTELGADRYLSGAGARSYLTPSTFEAAEVALEYQSYTTPRYEQCFDEFVRDLSIVDALFNVGADGTVELLRRGASR
ncbi:WbqC family protein [Natronolimnohabitans innermongolicus]|uniref:WbqC-like family protein n=1 Tax=Natronolimnohabitans innermongolicus JCM 12255 TaxID=1227499 RepID=L9WHS5_9EURY|nr:WbqC family protein [Natronolimnohabitans innermongolicus]ELY48912.1 WbqC-like family protein [Natronolimnohabitans innermongolicus JCM 12255]